MKIKAKTRLNAYSIEERLERLRQRRTGGGIHLDADIGPIKKGAFHKWLGKSENEPITQADIAKGKASSDEHVRKMAQFAENAKHWSH